MTHGSGLRQRVPPGLGTLCGLLGTVLCGGAVLLCGCTSGSGHGTSTPTPVSSSSNTGAATSASGSAGPSGSISASPSGSSIASGPPASSTSAGGVSPTASAAPCTDAQLSIAATRLPGAQDASYGLLTFTNSSPSPCAISGYPSASLLDSSNRPIGSPAIDSPGNAATIVLTPQAVASTLLKDSALNCQAQTRSSYVRVAAPGNSQTHDLALSLPPCVLSTEPVVAGTNPQP